MKLYSFFTVKVSYWKLLSVFPFIPVLFSHTEIILHFDDPILESLYILDPQWVCGNLYHAVQKANKESVNGKTKIFM